MDAIVSNPPFNAAQMFVFQTLSTARSEQERDELTSLYLDYIRKKLDESADKWWEDNDMTEEKFEEMCSNLHYRTPCTTK